jgi:hypothetical protein
MARWYSEMLAAGSFANSWFPFSRNVRAFSGIWSSRAETDAAVLFACGGLFREDRRGMRPWWFAPGLQESERAFLDDIAALAEGH